MEEKIKIRLILSRKTFRRGENIDIVYRIDNTGNIKNSYITLSVRNTALCTTQKIKKSKYIRWRLHTNLLRSGTYELEAYVTNKKEQTDGVISAFTIISRYENSGISTLAWVNLPGKEPYSAIQPDLSWWHDKGFDRFFLPCIMDPLSKKSFRISEDLKQLNMALSNHIEYGLYFHPFASPRWKRMPEQQVIDENGQRGAGRGLPDPWSPEVQSHFKKTVSNALKLYGDHPALSHALILSEFESPLSYSDKVKNAVKKKFKKDLSELYLSEKMLHETEIIGNDNFCFREENTGIYGGAAHGLINTKSAEYKFFLWDWTFGRGLVPAIKKICSIIKKKRPDLILWHDPYRETAILNQDAGLDGIATWIYSHPSTRHAIYIRLLQELARPFKKLVYADISTFVYENFAAPPKALGGSVIIEPDIYREILWYSLSHGVDGIQSYVLSTYALQMENLPERILPPETFDVMKELKKNVIQPFGASLRRCKPYESRIGILVSAASHIWKGTHYSPGAEHYMAWRWVPWGELLALRQLPFRILLDETVTAGNLKGLTTVIIPHADTLTNKTADELNRFSESGGNIISHISLRTNIKNAVLTDINFEFRKNLTGHSYENGEAITADDDEREMDANAQKLSGLLKDNYRPLWTDAAHILTNTLTGKNGAYFFIINDLRTYGPRFEKWKLRKEKGVAQKCNVFFQKKWFLYDACERKKVRLLYKNGNWQCEVSLKPCAGILLLGYDSNPQKILINCKIKNSIQNNIRQSIITLFVTVQNNKGKKIIFPHPLHIAIYNSSNELTEYGGYLSADPDGTLQKEYALGINEQGGEWRIRITHTGMKLQGKTSVKIPHSAG